MRMGPELSLQAPRDSCMKLVGLSGVGSKSKRTGVRAGQARACIKADSNDTLLPAKDRPNDLLLTGGPGDTLASHQFPHQPHRRNQDMRRVAEEGRLVAFDQMTEPGERER